MYLATYVMDKYYPSLMDDIFSLHTWQSPLFKPWQFVTYMFMHGNVPHIFSNMFALWMFGSVLENLWGPKRFLTFYFVCGLGAALAHMTVLYFETNSLLNDYNTLVQHFNFETFDKFFIKERIGEILKAAADNIQDNAEHARAVNEYNSVMNLVGEYQKDPHNISFISQAFSLTQSFVYSNLNNATSGASGAVFGCLAAFGYLFANTYVYIYFFLPLKAKWFVLIYAGLELYAGWENSAGDNIAHFAHLGGAIFGLALVYFWNKTNRQTFY
jgi:membrane associated rhomboid family serine protease